MFSGPHDRGQQSRQLHEAEFCLDAKFIGPVWGLEFVLALVGHPGNKD